MAWDLTVSTHSRPKAADSTSPRRRLPSTVSTHSRPKAADFVYGVLFWLMAVSTHSRPKAAEQNLLLVNRATAKFQHTAARRRLTCAQEQLSMTPEVSTHSRPKAAEQACCN